MAEHFFCGIDVAKDRLDVMMSPEGLCFSVRNDAPGWAELVVRLRPLKISAIGLEPSGGYERGVIRALLAAGLSVRRINPNKLRQFARARGVLAKNPADLASLPQPVVVNCTGYAARQLWSDASIVPVRGQIAWLIPQEGVHYGLNYKDLYVLARRDGIVIQPNPGGEDFGWNDDNETPDRAAAEAGVLALQQLYLRAARRSHSA